MQSLKSPDKLFPPFSKPKPSFNSKIYLQKLHGFNRHRQFTSNNACALPCANRKFRTLQQRFFLIHAPTLVGFSILSWLTKMFANLQDFVGAYFLDVISCYWKWFWSALLDSLFLYWSAPLIHLFWFLCYILVRWFGGVFGGDWSCWLVRVYHRNEVNKIL